MTDNSNAVRDTLSDDLLQGAEEIGAFLNEDPQRIYKMAREGKIPTFRLGQLLRARKSTLLAWIARQESAAA